MTMKALRMKYSRPHSAHLISETREPVTKVYGTSRFYTEHEPEPEVSQSLQSVNDSPSIEDSSYVSVQFFSAVIIPLCYPGKNVIAG